MSSQARRTPEVAAPKGAWQHFSDGLLSTSALALCTMLAVAVAIVLAAVLVITPEAVRDHGQRFLLGKAYDEDAYATIRSLQLASSGNVRPIVAVAGGSTIQYCVDEGFEEALQGRQFAKPFRLTTASQTMWDTVRVLEGIPAGARGVVVIGVSPGMFSRGVEELAELDASDRLAIESPLYEELVNDVLPDRQRPSGIYLLDHLRFFLARSGRIRANLMFGAPRYSTKSFPRTRLSETEWQGMGGRLSARWADYDEGSAEVTRVLERLLQHLHARTDVSILLLEGPINPRFLREFDRAGVFERHKARMARLAATYRADYLVLNSVLTAQDAEYSDWGHLSTVESKRACGLSVASSVLKLQGAAR